MLKGHTVPLPTCLHRTGGGTTGVYTEWMEEGNEKGMQEACPKAKGDKAWRAL